MIANNETIRAVGVRDMMLPESLGVDGRVRLTDVLYSPQLGYTLISVAKINDAGFSTTFAGGRCQIRNVAGEVIIDVPKRHGLYRAASAITILGQAPSTTLSLMELHRRMGHIAPEAAR